MIICVILKLFFFKKKRKKICLKIKTEIEIKNYWMLKIPIIK